MMWHLTLCLVRVLEYLYFSFVGFIMFIIHFKTKLNSIIVLKYKYLLYIGIIKSMFLFSIGFA